MHSFQPLKEIKWKRLGIVLCLLILAILAGYYIASSQNYFKDSGNDFFLLWLGPHLLTEGKNPYNTEELHSGYMKFSANWFTDARYLYPLPLAVFLIPMGFIPLEFAAVTWIALGIIAIFITCYMILSITRKRWQISYLIPILIGIFLLRSVAEVLRLGQLDWLILLFLTVGVLFWEKQKWLMGGLVIALTVMKPQIGVPLLFFLSIWLILRRKWSGIMGEGISLSALFITGWLFNHSWLWQWLEFGSNKVEANICCTPTLWGLASMMWKFNLKSGFILGIALTILLCSLMIFLLRMIQITDSRYAIGLSIPAALMVSPYLWTYSQMILIVPILLIVDLLKENNIRYLIVATFPLIIGLLSSSLVFISIRVGVDTISSLVPLTVFFILLRTYSVSKFKISLPPTQ